MENTTTEDLHRAELWATIVNHPYFSVGQREFLGLERFLAPAAMHFPDPANILHLGLGDGREVRLVKAAFPHTPNYLVNDICLPVLQNNIRRLQDTFPEIRFIPAHADIERPGAITELRSRLQGPTIVLFTGNAVIWSNRSLDGELEQALRPGDGLIITLEGYHPDMFRSYTIPPGL